MLLNIFPLPIFLVLTLRLFRASGKLNLHVKGFQTLLVLITVFNTDCLGLHFNTKNLLLKSLRAVGKHEIQNYTSNGIV